MGIELAWLEKHVVKSNLNDQQKEALKKVMHVSSFAKDDVLVREGELGGKLYLVRSGSVDVSRDIDGQNQRLINLGEGAVIGEVTFLSGDATTANVTAVEDSVIYTLTRDDFANLMREHPDLVFALFSYMLLYQSNVLRKLNADQVRMMSFMAGAHK